MVCEMKLAPVCMDCVKRLGVDRRNLLPLHYIQVAQLPEYDPKMLSGVQYPATSQAFGLHKDQRGTTKITYKVAKTVKETIDEHPSQSSRMGSTPGSKSSKH